MWKICDKCQSNKVGVIDSRSNDEYIYRRRKCHLCGHTITTREVRIGDFEQMERQLIFAKELKKVFKKYIGILTDQERTNLFLGIETDYDEDDDD